MTQGGLTAQAVAGQYVRGVSRRSGARTATVGRTVESLNYSLWDSSLYSVRLGAFREGSAALVKLLCKNSVRRFRWGVKRAKLRASADASSPCSDGYQRLTAYVCLA